MAEMLSYFRLRAISRAAALRMLELPQMDVVHASEDSVTVVNSTDD